MTKKLFSVLLVISLLCCALPFSAAALSRGDIDGTGSVTAADARLILRAAVGLDELSAEQKKAADINRDGSITSADARLALRAAVGLETLEEPEELTVPADFKVGFIFVNDENSRYDLAFITAAQAACQQLGIPESQYILRTNVPESDACYETVCELADEGCKLIFADSFGHEDFLIAAAKEFPDVEFCHAGGTKAHTAGLDNYHNAYAAIYEGRYLTGVAAGMKLNEMIESGAISENEAKLGFVGAFPFAQVISDYTAFFLGARSVCPTAEMEVMNTGAWYDVETERTKAQALIAKGCKVISQYSDSPGAPAACEESGVPNVAYNADYQAACSNTFLVSSSIEWTPYFVYMLQSVLKNEKMPADWTGTISTGSVVLSGLNPNAAAPGTAEAVNAASAALQIGERHVFDTAAFTVNGETLHSYLADVDDDPAYTADTEAVADGYFHECEYRSAPYFDIAVDGISGGGWDFF